MEKIAVGPSAAGAIDITKSITENLQSIAAAKKCKIKFIYFINPYLQNPKIKNLKKVTKMKQILNLIMSERN